jgi:hypothetical protein
MFLPVIIDEEAKRWWDSGRHPIFTRCPWLRQQNYFQLIENEEPALLSGDKAPRYARQVRQYAKELADAIAAGSGMQPPASDEPGGSIIILGHPTLAPGDYANGNPTLVVARNDLVARLRGRDSKVQPDVWDDGWLYAGDAENQARARRLQGPVEAIVRPVFPRETIEHVRVPKTTVNQLLGATGLQEPAFDTAKLRVSLWLPAEHKNDPSASAFVTSSGVDGNLNPRFSTLAAQEMAELLVPSAGAATITQISVEELDDRRVIENGRTARKIVEDELRACVAAGAQMARMDVEPPLVRPFLNYQRLANQIIEAKNGKIMLVAHDLQEHPAANTLEAHKLLKRKVQSLKDSVNAAILPMQGKLIPITLVVTNYENLKNDYMLDAEIAGMRWLLLPGRLHAGAFTPEQDIYEKVVNEVSEFLQQAGAGG